MKKVDYYDGRKKTDGGNEFDDNDRMKKVDDYDGRKKCQDDGMKKCDDDGRKKIGKEEVVWRGMKRKRKRYEPTGEGDKVRREGRTWSTSRQEDSGCSRTTSAHHHRN